MHRENDRRENDPPAIRNVTIFGGSRPDEAGYAQALQLGRLLGQAGYAILTGGYIGTMEAASRGASEAGGHVIGVTCDEIEAWRPVRPNPWVMEERRCPTLRQRITALIEGGDAAIALPGGPGTLAEISQMWNHLLIGAISPRPLILVGEGWRATFQAFYRSSDSYIPVEQRRWVGFATDVEAAVELLKAQP
jgi:uncharacterized protein (TIGR00730 family)